MSGRFSEKNLAPSAASRDAIGKAGAGRASLVQMVDLRGEFRMATPYLYGSYEEESEGPRSGKRSVVIIGSGRIALARS